MENNGKRKDWKTKRIERIAGHVDGQISREVASGLSYIRFERKRDKKSFDIAVDDVNLAELYDLFGRALQLAQLVAREKAVLGLAPDYRNTGDVATMPPDSE